MSEQHPSPTRAPLPPGIISAELYREGYPIDQTVLPWLQEPYPVTIVRCGVGDGVEYLLASAVGTHSNLTKAAQGLTEHQSNIVNNMFYHTHQVSKRLGPIHPQRQPEVGAHQSTVSYHI